MDDEATVSPEEADSEAERPEAVISARSALRALLALLAAWTFFSGLGLIFFQGGAGATIGGGEGVAAQRLLGVHLLVLAPLYGLLAWDPQGYRLLLWVPYAVQAGVVAVTVFDMVKGDRDVQDGILPLVVSATFLVLFVGVWRAGKRPELATQAGVGEPARSEHAPVVENSGEGEEPTGVGNPDPD